MIKPQCIANNFAKKLNKCGFKVGLSFEVYSVGTSVLILVTREDGLKMRMNFSQRDVRMLVSELDCAASQPGYDPFGITDREGA